MKVRQILTIGIVILSFSFLVSTAQAETFDVSGNAADSENSIKIKDSSETNVDQQTNTNIENKVDVNANTGGNSGGNVKTGDTSVIVDINNKTGENKADVKCCEPTKKPGPSVTPSGPTTTPGPNNGGNGGPSNGGNGGGGAGGPGRQVMGIAATSGMDKFFLYGLGLVCLGLGIHLKRPSKILKK